MKKATIPWALLFVAALLPLAIKDPYQRSVCIVVLMNISLAVSMRLILLTGQMTLAHTAFMAVGAYTSALLAKDLGLSVWLTMLVGGLTAAAIAALLGLAVLRIKGMYFTVATWALAEITRLVIIHFQHPLGGAQGISRIPVPTIAIPGLPRVEFDSHVEYFYLILLIATVTVFVVHRIEKSRTGLVLSSIESKDILAESVGVNIMAYKTLAFAIGSFFAGIVGGFSAHYLMFIGPGDFTVWQTIYLLVFIVVGGMQSVAGPIVGAVLLTVAIEALRGAQSSAMILFGGLLMLTMLFARGGLVGLATKIARLLARPRIRNAAAEPN